jgi:hypothetical protein
VIGELIDLWPSVAAGMVGGFVFWLLLWFGSCIASTQIEEREREIRATRARLAAKVGLDHVRRTSTPSPPESGNEPQQFTPSPRERDERES